MGKILSIEFNKSNIKVVEAYEKGSALSVLKYFSLDIATGIEEGIINDIGLIAHLIREDLIKNNIKTDKSVFVVNSDCIITRNMRLPFLENSDDILSMIRIELSQLIPIDFNQYKIKYNIAEIVEDGNMREAFYVIYCIPEKLFQDLKELAKILKMSMDCLHISFCCLNNIFDSNIDINGMPLDKENIYAFVDINSQYISFCTVNKSVNDFSRLSFHDQDEYAVETESESPYSYMGALEISEDSEDSLIFKYSILDKISRYIRYYHSVNNSNCIKKVYIYGENSKVTNISSFLSLKLKIEVEDINQIQGICFDAISLNDSLVSNRFFIPILSLFRDKNDLCFSMNEHTESVHRSKFLAIACGIIIILSSFKYYNEAVSTKINNMSLFVEEEDNIRQNEKIESLKEEVAYLEDYLEQSVKLKAVIGSEDYVNPAVLREIFNAIPQYTKVSAFSADRNGIQLSCFSESMEDVTLFLHNLREIEVIDEIFLSDIDVKQEGINVYSVMCLIKDVSDIVQ